ncbi:BACON domain-containing protein [Gaoshiqia sp. Z1-71]|uniref:BACON domain-containing protein n=1 Tax=Gaoshiqia hydrogeniformans TaxID=3290090 RepID=UPI003BF781B4
MKTNNFFGLKNAGMILFSVFFISAVFFTSCEKDDDDKDTGEPYFNIEGQPTGLSVTSAAKEQSYVVRSNRPWKVVAQSEGDWVRSFPDEGDDDGIFKIIVKENSTFNVRIMNFAFVVDGKEQPVLFRVEQEASVPYITVTEASTGVGVPAVGGDITINVKANVNWSYTIEDGGWLTETQLSATQIKLHAGKNMGDERQAKLTVSSSEYPDLAQEVILTQSPGNIILEEYFSWLAYGSAIFYTTDGEKRYDAWTEGEKAKGWTSTVNTVELSGNTPLCYARQGFVKLGKTNYGGDIISPKLSAIEGTVNVLVKFKAVPYMTAAGAKDDTKLIVSVIGPGTVSTTTFNIDNWPDYATDPTCTAIWADPVAERSFTITGATADTQIMFQGGEYDLRTIGAKKNRIFLDDIKVLFIE